VLKRLVLVLGVRGDASAFLDGIVRSYRGSIIYRRRLWSIRLSAGSAYRAPSYIEAAARFIDPATGLVVLEGTPSLSAPGIESFEVGAIVLIAQRLTLRPTLYLQRMSNLIVEDFGSLTRKTFTNDPNTRVVLGGELEAELKIRAGLAMEASFAGMYFRPADDGGQQPTVGVAQQNSAITAHVGIRGSLLGDRLGLSFGVLYTSPRSYDLRTGIPPAALQLDVPSLVRLDAAAQYRLTRRRPLTIYLKARSRLPHGVQDSPIPGASTIGTSVVLGLEYRGD